MRREAARPTAWLGLTLCAAILVIAGGISIAAAHSQEAKDLLKFTATCIVAIAALGAVAWATSYGMRAP